MAESRQPAADRVARAADLLASALDALAYAVFITDQACRVIHQNEAARTLPAHGPLCVRRGMLIASNESQNLLLRALICRAVKDRRGAVIPLAKGKARLVCRVVSVCAPADADTTPPLALVAVNAPSTRMAEGWDEMSEAFGLTPAEARVAAALHEGCSVEEIARKHVVTTATVRSQLQQLFLKTGTRRQAELVALIQAVLVFV